MKTAGVICFIPLLACGFLAGCSKAKDTTHEASAASEQSSEPVEMKVKWIVGKRYDQQLSYTEISQLKMIGTSDSMKRQVDTTVNFSVSALNAESDGEVEAELKFTSLKTESKLAGQTQLQFDSASSTKDDAKNLAAPILRKIIGAHFKYLIGANGEVKKVEDYDAFMNDLLSDSSPESKEVLKAVGLLDPNNIGMMINRGTGLPDKPVKPGDGWHFQQQNLESDFVFQRWEERAGHKCALIEFTGTLSPNSQSSAVMQTAGKMSGKIWFDPLLGMKVETFSDWDLKLTVMAQGTTVTSPRKMKFTINLLDVGEIEKQ